MKRLKIDQDDKQLAAMAAKLKEPKLTKQRRKTDKRQNPSAKVAHRATHAPAKKAKPSIDHDRDRGVVHLPPHPKEKQSFRAEPAKKKRRKPRPRTPKPPPRDITVPDAIDEVFMEIETLAQEMRDWADAMEDKLSHTQKYETVSSTADTLEGISNPLEGIDDADRTWLNELVIVGYQDPTPRRAGFSRPDRCGQCADLLESVADLLQDYKGPAERETIANDIYGDVEAAVSECQGVEFPGMYG